MVWLAVAALLTLSLMGVKSLYLFSASNGLFGHFEKCIGGWLTPSGKKLAPWTTNRRLGAVDWQIKAPAIFHLIFCEDYSHADTTLAGLSFLGAWGPSWVVIVLESLRLYSQQRFLSYITIPGILIFNHSHAVMTPLYLALRLAISPSVTPTGLAVHATHLKAIPWSFALGYILPIILMALPSPQIVSPTFKHTAAGWYQQWNVYIALIHWSLVFFWREDNRDLSSTETLELTRNVYLFAILCAGVAWWSAMWIALKKGGIPLALKAFVPASPWSRKKAASIYEGAKWLIQWDGIIGTAAMTVWAISLLLDANQSAPLPENMWKKMLAYFISGGPMAIPIGLLFERDKILLDYVNL